MQGGRSDLSISEKIVRARESAGLSQKQLAEIIGVSPSYLSRIERGERTPDSLSLLMGIAKATGQSITYFLPSIEGGPDVRLRYIQPGTLAKLRNGGTSMENVLSVPRSLVSVIFDVPEDEADNVFLYRLESSVEGTGIPQGSWCLVQERQGRGDVKYGDIVLVLYHGAELVRYYYPDGDKIVLSTGPLGTGSTMHLLPDETLHIVGVIRRYIGAPKPGV